MKKKKKKKQYVIAFITGIVFQQRECETINKQFRDVETIKRGQLSVSTSMDV